MSMAIPAICRLSTMAQLCRSMLVYELLAGITALRMRAPALDVETILGHFKHPNFLGLTR